MWRSRRSRKAGEPYAHHRNQARDTNTKLRQKLANAPRARQYRDKSADSSTKILVSWATGPKAASANQKTLLRKRPKIKRAGNARRKDKVHPRSALAVFLTALLTRAGECTARTLSQRKYRRIRETQHANGVPFHITKKNSNLGRRDNTRINAIPHEARLFRGPPDKDVARSTGMFVL